MTNDIVILRLVIEWTAQEEETNTWQDASLIWALTQITWRYSKSLLVTSSDLTRVRYSESLLVTSSDLTRVRYSESVLVTSSDLTRVRYSESILVTSSDGATK